MYQVCTIKDYGAGTLTISGIDGLKQMVNSQKADFLAIELVDTLKIEDLKMDLAVKKIYQLINKVNNVEYYYD